MLGTNYPEGPIYRIARMLKENDIDVKWIDDKTIDRLLRTGAKSIWGQYFIIKSPPTTDGKYEFLTFKLVKQNCFLNHAPSCNCGTVNKLTIRFKRHTFYHDIAVKFQDIGI